MFTLIHESEDGVVNTLEFEADYLPFVLYNFTQFLQGTGFGFVQSISAFDRDDNERPQDYQPNGGL